MTLTIDAELNNKIIYWGDDKWKTEKNGFLFWIFYVYSVDNIVYWLNKISFITVTQAVLHPGVQSFGRITSRMWVMIIYHTEMVGFVVFCSKTKFFLIKENKESIARNWDIRLKTDTLYKRNFHVILLQSCCMEQLKGWTIISANKNDKINVQPNEVIDSVVGKTILKMKQTRFLHWCRLYEGITVRSWLFCRCN